MEHSYFLLIFIGFIATFIGTLGGGGGLISFPAMLLLGVPIHAAIAANKFSNTLSSTSSFYSIWKRKEVNLRPGLKIVPFTLIGGLLGALIASSLSEDLLLRIAIILLISATGLNIYKSRIKKDFSSQTPQKLFYPTYIFIGAYDGLFGPGQATLLMHSFLNAGYSFLTSIGLTRLQTLSSCLISFTVYLSMGLFDWKVGVMLGIGSILGAQTAVAYAPKIAHLPWKKILTGFSIFLIIYLILKIL
ncbi:sulfite exporter TauE/SafE family protein [Sutcliffiella deserti]|uniref:sulfite exporter TauE/SafE family protein n=1 Tax=Sutcliffiella deserti TaxID=2875501 RepID=UPI001CBF77D7|nr:sulfite exporter TauE/SafE family protein [Sutcliffiella deserti]